MSFILEESIIKEIDCNASYVFRTTISRWFCTGIDVKEQGLENKYGIVFFSTVVINVFFNVFIAVWSCTLFDKMHTYRLTKLDLFYIKAVFIYFNNRCPL